MKFSGNAADKKNLLTAWAYWWKGFAYSRIGSVYIAGVINNEAATGTTIGGYADHNALITEANANFDKAASLLTGLTRTPDYDQVFQSIVPSFNLNTSIISPASWVRQINTYKPVIILLTIKLPQ